MEPMPGHSPADWLAITFMNLLYEHFTSNGLRDNSIQLLYINDVIVMKFHDTKVNEKYS